MSKIYREIDIICGLGEYPTTFTSPVINVKTENNICKLFVTFATKWIDYRKIIDIGYYDAAGLYGVESYEMTYDDSEGKYFFIVDRQFSYGDKAYFQFRALHTSGQEAVDAAILYLRFRDSIKSVDFDSIDSAPSGTMTEILEDFVQQHGNVNASTIHTGHVRIDNETIFISASGVISSSSSFNLGDHIDNVTIVMNASEIISAVIPTEIIYPLDLEFKADGTISLNDFSLLADTTSSIVGGINPLNSWYFYNIINGTGRIVGRTASYKFSEFTQTIIGDYVENADGYTVFGGIQIIPYGASPLWPDTFPTGDFDVRAVVGFEAANPLVFHLSAEVSGGTAPYYYRWYLGPVTDYTESPTTSMEFSWTNLEDLYSARIRLIVVDDSGRKVSVQLGLKTITIPSN